MLPPPLGGSPRLIIFILNIFLGVSNAVIVLSSVITSVQNEINSASVCRRGISLIHVEYYCRPELASCLIYAKPLRHPFRAFIEYICGCILFQDVTVREIRGR